ncbi:hypothetical protein KP509_12G073000 [Ceratopteris richardii]|uniref:Uncharacterized protein n=1 Tax=Ceratopteris richardii TaxID=49495 RepID=A0A8T2TQS9_CERRI|nr:hypothetical protein KP509_12G073000 [Ceratopteris richardii]
MVGSLTSTILPSSPSSSLYALLEQSYPIILEGPSLDWAQGMLKRMIEAKLMIIDFGFLASKVSSTSCMILLLNERKLRRLAGIMSKLCRKLCLVAQNHTSRFSDGQNRASKFHALKIIFSSFQMLIITCVSLSS